MTRTVTTKQYAEEKGITISAARSRLKKICIREYDSVRQVTVRGIAAGHSYNARIKVFEIPTEE